MDHSIKYWRQDEHVQNFGDFLSQYFVQNLFYVQPDQGRDLRIVGSCIDDMFVPAAQPHTVTEGGRQVFWGCGLRTEDGLSPDRLDQIEILSVRGPLTRSALRLGNTIPIGDPGLLLPALHRAAVLAKPTRAGLLIPHFHDQRPDAELLALTGCDEVLRPNIQNDLTAIAEFIDRIVSADFVLSGAMHGAIVAAAYGRPFAFWDSGTIDLPFKWRDFAASLSVPCAFQTDLAGARAYYETAVAPVLRLPVLWPMLVAAPLPVRPDAFVSVMELDIGRHGAAALDITVSSLGANKLQARLRAQIDAVGEAERLRDDLAERKGNEQSLLARIADLSATEQRLAAELDVARPEIGRLDHEASVLRAQIGELQEHREHLQRKLVRQQRSAAPNTKAIDAAAEIARLQAREAWLAAEEARLHEAVQDRNIALADAEARLQAEQARTAALKQAPTWSLAEKLRGLPIGQARRAARLAWLTVTFRLGDHLRRRRRLHAEISLVASSPLFDAGWYAQTYRYDVDKMEAARHYIFAGNRLGYAPNQMFDGAWYLRAYPAAMSSGWTTPLAHYIAEGAASGFDPHPLFESAWYGAANPSALPGPGLLTHYLQAQNSTDGVPVDTAPNRLFDVAGYRAEYAGMRATGLDPVQHYIAHGAALGYDPHPLFDTDWYLASYPDARASGMNPLAHYLRHGMAAGHDCTPLMRQVDGLRPDTPLGLPHWADPEASIVIPVFGHYYDTARCLYALAAHSTGVSFETILIDDDPSNPVGPLLQSVEGLRVVSNPKNLGFLLSCNQAGALARGWHIVFLNNDTVVMPGWLEPLLRLVRTDPAVGIVGCKLLNADGTVQEAGGIIFDDGWGCAFGQGDDPRQSAYNYVRDVDVVTGAAFLVQRHLFQVLGGFDTRYAPAFYEEFDLAFEARRAGYRVVYQPASAVIHLGSQSYGAATRDLQSLRNHAQFCLKWEEALFTQPTRGTDLFLARQRPDSGLVVLMIDDKVPEYDRHAGALTVFQYIGLFRRMGVRVVFAPADGVAREPYAGRLRDMGVEVLCSPVRLDTWLAAHGRNLLAIWTARPDVTAPLLGMLREHSQAEILYYPHDLHFLRERRRYELEGDLDALAESVRLRRMELAIFAEVDCVMTPSLEEARIIAECVPGARIQVIPPYLYGAGTAAAQDARTFADRHDVLFVGGFKHPPNVDAVLWLAREIMPLLWQTCPDAKLVIVGDEPTPAVQALADDRVEVTGFVLDLTPYFARARLCAAPLRYGAGVKGKIVSALQAGVPVVTTAVGNEGIALVDGSEVLLGETAASLADAMRRLFDDASLCAELSRAGVAVIEERFSERRARQAMLDVLDVEQCQVCGQTRIGRDSFAAQGSRLSGSWSTGIACDGCYASRRSQALAEILLDGTRRSDTPSLRAARPYLDALRIHAFGETGAVGDMLKECRLFTCSEHLDGIVPGQTGPGEILCQDVQDLTFRDGEFDLLISEDVVGHLADVRRGLAEVFRVLKPGGRHVFTVPSSAGDDWRDLLADIGFETRVHAFGHRDEPDGHGAVFETMKPSIPSPPARQG